MKRAFPVSTLRWDRLPGYEQMQSLLQLTIMITIIVILSIFFIHCGVENHINSILVGFSWWRFEAIQSIILETWLRRRGDCVGVGIKIMQICLIVISVRRTSCTNAWRDPRIAMKNKGLRRWPCAIDSFRQHHEREVWRRSPLQRFQEAAVFLVHGLGPSDHLTKSLRELYWLPIRFRMVYKLGLLLHNVTIGSSPDYATEILKNGDGRAA